jgi:3-hydroxyacyl-[acyl-carrier-protein] dehydratase
MNREEIKTFLPHREPMLLLDEAELDENGNALGRYTVRGDEWFLQGHFPGNPVVPGVVLCEIIAQTAGVLLRDMLPGKTTLYAGMDNVRFRHMVRPGETVNVTCRITRSVANVYVIAGEATVSDAPCASGVFTLMLAG